MPMRGIRPASSGFTLLEVTLAVLVGIALLAGVTSAFKMYRHQALVQQAKTELQQIRSELAMAAYQSGIPCSSANSTLGGVSFAGGLYYLGGWCPASSVQTTGTTTTLTVATGQLGGFFAGQVVGYWYQDASGQFVEGGTAIMQVSQPAAGSITLLNSTIDTTASGFSTSGYLCSELSCNLAGRDSANNPIPFLDVQPPQLAAGSTLPVGAGIRDPWLGVDNVRWVGSDSFNTDASLPATSSSLLDFEYTSSPDNSSSFGGLVITQGCQVSWVLPSTWPNGVALSPTLPNFQGDPPVNW